MNKILQDQLTRLEAALTTLSDSVTSYNPSPDAARELIAADDALSEGLDQLAIHQSNTAQLAHLHALSAQLSQTFKSTLSTLAATRAEILATPVSLPLSFSTADNDSVNTASQSDPNSSSRAQPVSHTDLLSFARNVSRYTAPPSFKPPSVLRAEAGIPASTNTNTNTNINANGAPPDAPSPKTQTQALQTSFATSDVSAGVDESDTKNPALQTLSDNDRSWLDPLTNVPFLPWPDEAMIARSGLARAQGWAGAEEGAGAIGGGEEGRGGVAGIRGGDAAETQKEGEEDDVTMEDAGTAPAPAAGAGAGLPLEASRRVSMAVPAQGQEQKASVFEGLDLYDPEEE